MENRRMFAKAEAADEIIFGRIWDEDIRHIALLEKALLEDFGGCSEVYFHYCTTFHHWKDIVESYRAYMETMEKEEKGDYNGIF